MTANLLFSQAIFQNYSPDGVRAMTGVSVQNCSAASETYAESSGVRRESFLNNLEQLSNDLQLNYQKQGVGGGISSGFPAYISGDKSAAASHPAAGHENGLSETTRQLEEDLNNEEDQIIAASNVAVVIRILENLELYDSNGGSSSANKVDGFFGNTVIQTEPESRMVLGQNDDMPSVEMKTELERLQQFITNAQMGNASFGNDEHDLGEYAVSRSMSPNLNQLMNPVAKKLPNDISQTGSSQSVENSQDASPSGKLGEVDSIKLAVSARSIGVEAIEDAKQPRPLENTRTDASGLKDAPDTPGKTGAPSQVGLFNRISSAIDSGKPVGGESAAQSLSNNEPSPVLKLINDAQLSKENHHRMDSTMSDELGGKITKVDVAANENGQLSSQNQTTQKAFEAASPSTQTDTGQDSLRTQTLDQIVRKAVIYMRNGQHEAKIDLKPDFLGHVRMQVIIENHQVTVKILTEAGFVKDMVENNIYQLKADLQQQGLNVDKLEVAVSSDSDDDRHSQEKAGQAKDRQPSVAGITPGNREEETREQAGNFGLRKAGAVTVDYFA